MEHFRKKGQPPLTEQQKKENREAKKRRTAYYKGLEEQRKASEAEQRKTQAYWQGLMEYSFSQIAKKREQAQIKEPLYPIKLPMTDKELKLLNQALNAAATENEWQSALIKWGELLRSPVKAKEEKVNPFAAPRPPDLSSDPADWDTAG